MKQDLSWVKPTQISLKVFSFVMILLFAWLMFDVFLLKHITVFNFAAMIICYTVSCAVDFGLGILKSLEEYKKETNL